jgi:glutamate carboxypeptidase
LSLLIATLALFSSRGSAHAEDPIQGHWLELLKTLVLTNSGTENTPGQDKVRAIQIPEFKKLGFEATTHALAPGHKVLSFELPGAKPTLLLLGHTDTVFKPTSKFQTFTSDAESLKGPGVIDMKGGIVLLLNVLAELKDQDRRLLERVRVGFNDDEEIGSPFSRAKLLDLAKGLRYGLVFEPGHSDGALVTAHSGVCWLEIQSKGKAAHAGLAHQDGINACVELAHKLVKISKLTDYPNRLTVNVGTIQGGTVTNVVCEEASATIDIRFAEPADLDGVLKKIQAIAESPDVENTLTHERARTSIKEIVRVPPMSERSTKTLFRLAQEAGAAVQQEVKGRPAGYVSDANRLASSGMNLLVGLGPYGSGMHTEAETLLKRSYPERLALVKELVRRILGNLGAAARGSRSPVGSLPAQ